MQKTQSKTLSLKTKAAVTIIILILVSTAVVQGTLRIQDPTGSTNGYWEGEKYIRNSNGKTWTANNANLQAAIWDLNNTGGTVWLPSGNITISSTIEIDYDSITIVGSGSKNYAAEGATSHEEGTVLWVETDLLQGVFKARGSGCGGWTFADNFILRDITILSDKSHNVVGVNLTCTSNSMLENVFFYNINGEAIWMNNCHGPNFIACFFKNCGNSTNSKPVVWMTSDDTYVTAPYFNKCVFEPCDYAWIESAKSPPSGYNTGAIDGKISNCYFEGSGTKPTYGIIPGVRFLIYSNNFIGGVSNSYIYLSGEQITNVQINDNTFSSANPYAICCRDSANNIMITDNFFEQCNYSAYLSVVHNISISGNRMIGTDTDSSYGIEVSDYRSKFITINDNIISGYDKDLDWIGIGIKIAGRNNIIKNNVIYNCELGIRVSGNNNTVYGNHLWNITRSDWELSNGGVNNIVYNNFGTEGYAEKATNTFIFPTHNSTALQSGFDGYAWFNTTSNELNVYNGSAWVSTTLT